MSRSRKAKREGQTADIRLRLSPSHKDLMQQAADHSGLTLSAWLRHVALKAAREELGEGGT